jgi:hypothetical protein
MSNVWFSNMYGATGVLQDRNVFPKEKSAKGVDSAAVLRNYIVIEASRFASAIVDNDLLVFCELQSSDRIYEVKTRWTDEWEGFMDMDIGIYDVGHDSPGPVVDVDLFGADHNIGSIANYADKFESGSLVTEDIGKPLWELLGLSADPVKLYNLVGTLDVTSPPGVGGELRMILTFAR